MRVDLHVHTRESSAPPEHWFGELVGAQECYTQAESALTEALRKGLDAVAITNHDSADDALRLARTHPGTVIPGCEYKVYAGRGSYVHVVALGIDADVHARLMHERSRGLARFAGFCRGKGLAHFLAHPAWEVGGGKRGIDPADLLGWLEHFDAIETLNGNCHIENEIASGLARFFRKGRVGGSDAHDLDQIGAVWTEAEAETIPEFLDRVRAGETAARGRPVTHGEFAAAIRAVAGTFYRRQLLKTMSAGPFVGYIARARFDEVLRTAGGLATFPALLVAPQAASAAYFGKLRVSAERLRGRLADALDFDLADSIAREELTAEERSRGLIAGLRELEAAFGGA
jgi:predicted metal-dependent phosphoesterase TrpH